MSKRILAGMAIAALAIMPLGGHAAPGPEGCALVASQGQATATISEAGNGSGIIAGGSWKVTIIRVGEATPIVHEGVHSTGDVLTNVFQAGDQITCETPAGQGAVVAGKI